MALAAATPVKAATVVTPYSLSSGPVWVTIADGAKTYNSIYVTLGARDNPARAAFNTSVNVFTRGTDLGTSSLFNQNSDIVVKAWSSPSWVYGAVFGNSNYASFDLNGDSVLETVAQFHFDPNGGSYVMASASNDDGSALSISAGQTAINQPTSAVPEPSTSQLVLIALGSAGVLTRRRLKPKA